MLPMRLINTRGVLARPFAFKQVHGHLSGAFRCKGVANHKSEPFVARKTQKVRIKFRWPDAEERFHVFRRVMFGWGEAG